ncbi:MAG: O-antigen ligase family protein [Acaryochloridaceae cyanobacterium RU_4_10]|nr:O-antigen ligase family protein [Acaryochloridaceae cyanobacterium RU_4_10]
MKISLVNFIIFSSIIGTYFLAIPVLVVLGIGISLIGFFVNLIHSKKFRINKIGILILINFLYWIISGFLVGAIDFTSFADPLFYDGDARVFLSYSSLLFFCVSSSNLNSLHYSLNIIRGLSSFSFLLFLFWIPTKAQFISEGLANNFAAFLTSHTGAGTFFGFLSIILFFYGYFNKSKFDLILSFMMLLAVFGTGSRATVVGLVIVGFWFVFSNFKLKKFIFISLISIALLAILPIIATHTFERISLLFDSNVFTLIFEQIKIGESDGWEPGYSERELASGEANILSRIVFWSYAIHRFLQSPVFGIGWGRYNDLSVNFSGIPGLIYIATSGDRRFGAASAHNSYLMLLCESGIIGLVLLLWLWWSIYLNLNKAKIYFSKSPSIQSYFIAAQGTVWFTLTAAMFGHSLAAHPSVSLY